MKNSRKMVVAPSVSVFHEVPQASKWAIELARSLASTLPVGMPGLFNPWGDACVLDRPWNDSAAKLSRLANHLDCVPKVILCGEAPGYAGARHSGVAFTSERQIVEGSVPRLTSAGQRLTARPNPFSELSATIVWETLGRLGIAEQTITWNAVQLHPHHLDNAHSNRTPRKTEVALGVPAMKLLTEAFPSARIFAVGRTAEKLLLKMGFDVDVAIRHPANGGANLFRSGLTAAIAHLGVSSFSVQ